MFYDGPPGLVLDDLIGPSPDGVDLEWIHPYTYARNNPINRVDPSGLRSITIQIHYYFEKTATIAGFEAIKAEVERIFNACLAKCKNDTITFKWNKVLTEKELKDFKGYGFSGGNFFGYNPTQVDVSVKDTLDTRTYGITGKSFDANINVGRLITMGETRGYKPFELLAMAIAHEIGLHAIGGVSGHFEKKDFIDAEAGKPGTEFSKKTCDKIMDRLNAT